MKRISSFSGLAIAVGFLQILAILALSSPAFGQETWTRLESGNKDISFVIPSNFLYHKERTDIADVMHFSAYTGGTSVTISVSNQPDAKSNVGRAFVDQARKPAVLDFETETGVRGRSVTFSDQGYEHKLFLASNKGYYVVRILSDNKDDASLARILRELKVKGKSIFEGTETVDPLVVETVSMKTLKTSPEIEEALERKRQKWAGNLRFEPLSKFVPCEHNRAAQPPILLSQLSPGTLGFNAVSNGGPLKINVQLLASGQVGDIVVYSDTDRSVQRAFADSAKAMRFIPAKINGVAADHCETIPMMFGVETGIVAIPGR